MQEEGLLGGGGAPATPPEGAPPVDAPPVSGIWDGIDVKFPEGFDDGLRAEPSLKPFVNKETGEFNMANVLKSYIHTKRQMGEDKVTLPKETSTKEEIDQFWAKLGWVGDEKEYSVPKPEESAIDDEFLNGFNKFAHENRIPKAVAQKMVGFLDTKTKEGLAKSQATQSERIKQGLEGLQTEWGQAYDTKLGSARRVLNEVVKDEGVMEMFKDPSVGSNPAVIKALAAIGEKLFKEDGFKGNPTETMFSPEEASRKINQIMGDASHAYNIKGHPAHNDAVKEMLALHGMRKAR